MVSNLALFIVIIVLVGVGAGYIKVLNRKHAGTRERLGKSAEVIDLSMQSKKEYGHGDETGAGEHAEVVGDKGFEDTTDLKNEDFIYVY